MHKDVSYETEPTENYLSDLPVCSYTAIKGRPPCPAQNSSSNSYGNMYTSLINI